MKLTVLTATRNVVNAGNRERMVRCLESVAKVPIPHEHLVYDGASTDGTLDTLKELAKKIKTLRVVSEPDTGLYNALNKGVSSARGEWVLVLGADDYIDNQDELVAAVKTGDDNNCDVVASPVMFDNGILDGCHPEVCLCGMPYPHPGAIVRSSVLRNMNGFDESYRIIADFDLMQRLIFSGANIFVRDRPFVAFHLGGLSSNIANTSIEHRRLAHVRFGLREKELECVYPKRILPLRIACGLLTNRNSILRKAARYQILRYFANLLLLIGKEGTVRRWGRSK